MLTKPTTRTCCLCNKTYTDNAANSKENTCHDCFEKIFPYSFNHIRKKAFLSLRFNEIIKQNFSEEFKREILGIVDEDIKKAAEFKESKSICDGKIAIDESKKLFIVKYRKDDTDYHTLVYGFSDLKAYYLNLEYSEYDSHHYLERGFVTFELNSKFEQIFQIPLEFEDAAMEIKKKKNIESSAEKYFKEIKSVFGISAGSEIKTTY